MDWEKNNGGGKLSFELILGDCLEIMKEMPDNSVSVIITDPPYGVSVGGSKKPGTGGKRAKKRSEEGCFEDSPEHLTQFINEFVLQATRISPVVALFAGIKTLTHYPQPEWIIAWVYENKNNFCPYGFNQWTPILCYGKDPYQQKRRGNAPLAVKTDVINCNSRANRKLHPTPKPIPVMREIILRLSTEKDDIILDPFAGSFTTGVACIETGRKFIGIEIDPDYYKVGKERMENAQRLSDTEENTN